MTLDDIPTPSLVLDLAVLRRNTRAMADRMTAFGVNLRPHCKTAKSADVARIATEGHSGGITVSTLREAEYFADNGFTDITLAVQLNPAKLPRAAALQARGVDLGIITDDETVAQHIVDTAKETNTHFAVYIDIDTGYGRSGVLPDSDALLAIGRILNDSPNTSLRGVLTHAGQSYGPSDEAAIAAIAEDERARTVAAAEHLRAAGLPCPVVSVGSTPSMRFARSLEGVTEARPGTYVFNDLMMVGRGICTRDDIAATVLTCVIANHSERNHALVDAGALALSNDTGANSDTMPGVGYGIITLPDGSTPWGELIVRNVSQEQGWLGMRDTTQKVPTNDLPIGTRLRVLPNHTCVTCSAHDQYYVIDGSPEVIATWPRVNRW